jgi:hypothetical protein
MGHKSMWNMSRIVIWFSFCYGVEAPSSSSSEFSRLISVPVRRSDPRVAKPGPPKVCPVNLRGEVCTADNCGSKHPQVCLVADHGKGKIPKSTCVLWHMRMPRENPTARLEAECRAEELKARIRATKMMSQGISYSQMVEGPPHQVPDHVALRAARTVLTPDGAIAILEDAVERLRLLLP